LWLSFPGPTTGSLVGGARVLSIALALLSPVAAINCPCCGGSPMTSTDSVTGSLVGCARAGCARTLSLPSAVIAVAARLPRAMPFPAPVPGSFVCCAYAGSAPSCAAAISCHCYGGSPPKRDVVCACTRVAAISCLCCGGSPSKGNAVTSACDCLLGRLCSRWLRSHVVAAISCLCCGGSPSKGNAVTSACDCLLGRLCSRWLRLHSWRCHQLSLLWRLAFQGQCCHQCL
jgi:hypothetical protein